MIKRLFRALYIIIVSCSIVFTMMVILLNMLPRTMGLVGSFLAGIGIACISICMGLKVSAFIITIGLGLHPLNDESE